jgi:hypothetical protein
MQSKVSLMPKTPDELDRDDGDERWMEMEERKEDG